MGIKIKIVGPAYPYRGGIATFDEMLARTFTRLGNKVDIETFRLQYPEFLFPGKTQFSEADPPVDLDIRRTVNSINPLNWIRTGRRISREKPDLLVMKYWTPFIGPCLGTIARLVRKNRHTRVIVQVDNIVPHEHHFTDTLLNKYFVASVDGFVYMSEQVRKDLDTFTRRHPSLFSPHPIFENFGKPVSRGEACRELGLDPAYRYSMFFGLVRDYKGLDILLEAWKELKNTGDLADKKLIVAGEFYIDKKPYMDMITGYGLSGDVIVHDRFIRDDLVKYYFCASDLLIQPYKMATQSGVTQIAYNFDLPMIVTGVGGLAEIVSHDVAGYVVDVSAGAVAEAFRNFYRDGNAARLIANMATEKEKFSWDAMAGKIMEVYRTVKR